MSKRISRLSILVLFLAIGAVTMISGRPVSAGQSGDQKTAEQQFKNIQVFKGTPASELIPSMRFMAASLGVRCDFCHVNPFEKDEKPEKQTARKMVEMMRKINADNFKGATEVTCATCHQGHSHPTPTPPLAKASAGPAPAAAAKPTLPAVDDLLATYVKAIGGKEAVEKLKARVMKGSVELPNGMKGEFEMYEEAPNKMALVTTTARGAQIQVFDGTNGWTKNGDHINDLAGAALAAEKREATFYKEISLNQMYSKLSVTGVDKVGDRDAYVVRGMAADGGRDRLYFDTQTGLLLRVSMVIPTQLGPSPEVVDFEDYREVDGVKLPFLVRTSSPEAVIVQKVSEIHHNVAIDQAKFQKPAPKS